MSLLPNRRLFLSLSSPSPALRLSQPPAPNPITAQHCIPLSLKHPCVHITPHASPGATHHTPHSASLHPPSASWPGRERTTTGTASIKIRTLSERETNEKGTTTQGVMRFPLRTGRDSRNMTDATHFAELTLC